MAFTSRQPTTLEHLTTSQQKELFKVLHLLNSPAHLTASRQTSRSLSTGNPCGSSTSPSRALGHKNSTESQARASNTESSGSLGSTGSITRTLLGSSAAGTVLSPPETKLSDVHLSRVVYPFDDEGNCVSGSIEGRSSSISGCCEHSSNCCKGTCAHEICEGDTNAADKPGSPSSREALLSDNVFTTSSSLEQSVQRSREKRSLCINFSANSNKFVHPKSFLCVPIPDPSTRRVCSKETGDGAVDLAPIVVLACFIDKISCSIEEKSGNFATTELSQLEVEEFSSDDVKCIEECFKYVGVCYFNELYFSRA